MEAPEESNEDEKIYQYILNIISRLPYDSFSTQFTRAIDCNDEKGGNLLLFVQVSRRSH
jgi:hypothetical protein